MCHRVAKETFIDFIANLVLLSSCKVQRWCFCSQGRRSGSPQGRDLDKGPFLNCKPQRWRGGGSVCSCTEEGEGRWCHVMTSHCENLDWNTEMRTIRLKVHQKRRVHLPWVCRTDKAAEKSRTRPLRLQERKTLLPGSVSCWLPTTLTRTRYFFKSQLRCHRKNCARTEKKRITFLVSTSWVSKFQT